jgi:hypothetical protein
MNKLLEAAGASVVVAAALWFANSAPFTVQRLFASTNARTLCDQNGPLCTEVYDSLDYGYTGHDEPSLLFYSGTAGSGNNMVYTLTLPTDPPTRPTQSGTGGTYNFQLHPAFWFGMAMCDDESAPNPGPTAIPCTPNSDANIYTSSDGTSASYIGRHPGGAYMEMQFYPPGWVLWPAGVSCDPTKWCAALTIDSLNENMNTGIDNNRACLRTVGIEPVNFAFITRTGVAHAPADPIDATAATYTSNSSTDLLMNAGDKLTVALHDTADGFEVIITDLTTKQSGSMKASVANGFAHVKFDPSAQSCSVVQQPFHPMYSTSSENTRIVWAAHSYNVAFSDEIGHFEYCSHATSYNGGCSDRNSDADDQFCFNASDSSDIQVGGCIGTDGDFNGVPYQLTWPGTLTPASADQLVHPSPILFTSPLFGTSSGRQANYDRVAFETDLPRIETTAISPNNNCNRTTGAGCVNPPNGAAFYPIYSTRAGNPCQWQLGGPNIEDTQNDFGGTSAAEYGNLYALVYPSTGFVTVSRYNNFRQALKNNPCRQ